AGEAEVHTPGIVKVHAFHLQTTALLGGGGAAPGKADPALAVDDAVPGHTAPGGRLPHGIADPARAEPVVLLGVDALGWRDHRRDLAVRADAALGDLAHDLPDEHIIRTGVGWLVHVAPNLLAAGFIVKRLEGLVYSARSGAR